MKNICALSNLLFRQSLYSIESLSILMADFGEFVAGWCREVDEVLAASPLIITILN